MQDIQRKENSSGSIGVPAAQPAPEGSRERCQILAKKGFLQAKRLTSNVALLIYSHEFQLGVLFHLDPVSQSRVNEAGQAFTNSALGMILSEFSSLGVRMKDLVTYAVGGSSVDGMPEATEDTVRRTLAVHGLSLSACDLGGTQKRSIWLDVETGRTIVRSESIRLSAENMAEPLQAAS